MSSLAEPTFAAASASDVPDLLDFFARSGNACHCQYWHFSGSSNAWLERCNFAASENARALAADLSRAPPSLRGVVARAFDQVVGWMKLCPAEDVKKLYEQRLYRNLPCFGGERQRVYTVGCFLVDPERRRHGVSSGLLKTGIALARAAGASALEAFPRRGEALAAEEQWTGIFEIFERAGFRAVNDFAPYPVLRLEL